MNIDEKDILYDKNDEVSNLMEIAKKVRPKMEQRNFYQPTNMYNLSHPDAISDGDDLGREPKNESGTIGTKTDINQRKTLLAKNLFTEKRPYRIVE